MKSQKFQSYKARAIHSLEYADHTLGFSMEAQDAVVTANFRGEDKMSEPYTAVCGGAARGGTTILSYILSACGLPLGSDYGGEDQDFLQQRFEPDGLLDLIHQRNAEYQSWGFKIPGMSCGHYAFFEENARNPVFIYIFRSPFSTALSIIKRAGSAGFSEDRGGFGRAIQASLTSYTEFLQFMRQTDAPVIMISMEAMKKNPQDVVRALVERLNLSVSEQKIAAIAEQISVSGYKRVENLAV
ncbi:MAG: hypothetical protein V4712_07575 [Pseudomonadota bacterium]